jgi:hypothetical protein
MKLYAQHGYGDGQKTAEGLTKGLIEGVIFSPKDIARARLQTAAQQVRRGHRRAEVLFDPQFYATIPAVDPAASLGYLVNEIDGAPEYPYFQPRRRSQLLSERLLTQDLDATLRFQAGLPDAPLIAPNIVVPRSFNSAEAAICMDFTRNTRKRYDKLKDARPVLATLAVAREALMDKEELLRFLNDLTVLDDRPDGFYILIAVNSTEARSEVYHADVIAGWMYINHVLKLSGYRVVNGYSDILSPFLGAVGADAGATGWWSNLRAFSMDRFAPPLGGGRLPVERYLSCSLLNRIAFYELAQLREVIPEVLNERPTDALYPEDTSQPQRNQEVLQSWDAIRELNERLVRGNPVAALRGCRAALEDARRLYAHIAASLPQPLDPKSNDQHLDPLQEGITLFTSLAEL